MRWNKQMSHPIKVEDTLVENLAELNNKKYAIYRNRDYYKVAQNLSKYTQHYIILVLP